MIATLDILTMRNKTSKTARAGPGVACAAPVASSVTLYGIADAGFGHGRYSLSQGGTQVSSSHNGLRSGYRDKSRLGLRGSEDLGSGLNAVFRLEQGINLQDGKIKNGLDRLALVGLRGAGLGINHKS